MVDGRGGERGMVQVEKKFFYRVTANIQTDNTDYWLGRVAFSMGDVGACGSGLDLRQVFHKTSPRLVN